MLEFFQSRGLPLVIEAHKRAFPKTQKAFDVFLVLEKYLADGHVEIKTNSPVSKIVEKDGRIEKVFVGKTVYTADSFILATGGVSHPETGSTGDGFKWLKDIGFDVQNPTPTLVPIVVAEKWVKKLSGISLDPARVTFFVDGMRAFVLKGRILFTHFGLSGPTILNAASKISDALHEGEVTALIDAFPNTDHGMLDKQLVEFFDANKNKSLKNVFKAFAPDGMSDAILTLALSSPERGGTCLPAGRGMVGATKVHSLKKEDRKMLIQTMKSLSITVEGLMGNDMAIVSDGGLPLFEIEGKTMRTKKYDNLYVTGDLLHIRRPSGGFSLQLCWTTGWIAGEHC